MSDSEHPPSSSGDDSQHSHSQGPSLKLLYSLLALALIAAICIAMMIVLPFYQRR
jgi:hypothetical protein